MEELAEKQMNFLKKYAGLLSEVREAAHYAGEWYIQEQEDVADRLLTSISAGLLSYNPGNMTLHSIFSDNEQAMKKLEEFYKAALAASEIQISQGNTQERMHLLYEVFLPALEAWQKEVQSALQRGGNHATH
ncbi:hypothetical protein [Alkalicoccus halolimnae]|uniref:DUF8042 domain-containing protein n=1 Tax=Alkalicoccus halolimnae TaxID=1667239 RepID=A0A5C7FF02_9BACI|nr:hypothetical protein [Alkalicoccus halolimnae]TXF84358.1 hypothetical protein FTX54_11465 [Alkalicoccus halolimnae]